MGLREGRHEGLIDSGTFRKIQDRLGGKVRAPVRKDLNEDFPLRGSVAGRQVLAGSMYAATKWAVSAIGYGLREELRGTGVRVTLIEPGMADTPVFDEPKPDALRPDDIARSVLYALDQSPTVDVHELMVLPTPLVD